jgi:glutathione S-transferase
MYKLYHQKLCPFSRKVRICLAAKNVQFQLITENFWERRREFIALNPALTVPVLLTPNNHSLSGSYVITEYLEEKYDQNDSLIGRNIDEKAEARQIQSWFDEKFFTDVSKYLIYEKYFKKFLNKNNASPESHILNIASENLITHLNYIEFLTENRQYLAADRISIADFAAAAHISVLDYFGYINWRSHPMVKSWYSLVKSHQSFGGILKDRIANINPPEYYSKLDF